MTTEPLDAELIFVRQESTHNMAAWCLVGGLAGIGFAVVGFCLAVMTGIGQFAMHSISTVPMPLGISALAAARVLSRMLRRCMHDARIRRTEALTHRVRAGPREICGDGSIRLARGVL